MDQAPSPATVKRLKSSFLKLLPVALDYQFGVLRRLVIDLDVDALIVSPGSSMTETMDRSTIYRYRYSIKDYLESILKRYRIQPSKFLLCWAQNLMRSDKESFTASGLKFRDIKDIPADIRVESISDSVASALTRDRRNPNTRRASVHHALQVAKQAGLHHQPGDIVSLQKGNGCSKKFSTKILKAVDDDAPIEDIIGRKVRSDCVKMTNVCERLTTFLSNAEHSRALPGHETVSVAYGCRKPKFLLKKSKNELLDIFKNENPDITLSHSVLLRDWPANFVPPTHKDSERNVCPLHANARRCLDGLKKAGAAANLPKSIRSISAGCLCASPDTVPLDPLTWPRGCALGL